MPRGRSSFSLHAATAFLLPSGCAASRRLLAPARCAPRLLRLRPSRDVPRWGPSLFARGCASETPPRHARSVTRSLRRHGRWHPPGGMNTPHSEEPERFPTRTGLAPTLQDHQIRSVVVNSAPRVGGAITPERAGPRRAARRGETARPPLADAEGPLRRSSPSGRSRRRRESRPERDERGPRPSGQKNLPRSGKGSRAAHPRGKKNLHGVEKQSSAAIPRDHKPGHAAVRKSRVELRLELPYFTPSSSTSKISVALGGIKPG